MNRVVDATQGIYKAVQEVRYLALQEEAGLRICVDLSVDTRLSWESKNGI